MSDPVGPPPTLPPSYPWPQPPPPVGNPQWPYPAPFPPSPFMYPPIYPQPVVDVSPQLPWPYPGQPPPNMNFPAVPPNALNIMPPGFPHVVAPPLPSFPVPPLPPPVHPNPPLPLEPCPPPPDSEDASFNFRFPASDTGLSYDSQFSVEPMQIISVKKEPLDEDDYKNTHSSRTTTSPESYKFKVPKKEPNDNDQLKSSKTLIRKKPDSHSREKSRDSKKSRTSSPSRLKSSHETSEDHHKKVLHESLRSKKGKSGKSREDRSTSSPSPERVKKRFKRSLVYADYAPEVDPKRSSQPSHRSSSSHKSPVRVASTKTREDDRGSHKSKKKSSSSHGHKRKRHSGEDGRRDGQKKIKTAEKASKKSRSSKSTDGLDKKKPTPDGKLQRKHHSSKKADKPIAEKIVVGNDETVKNVEADTVPVSTSILEDKGKNKKSTSVLEGKDENKKSTSLLEDKDKNSTSLLEDEDRREKDAEAESILEDKDKNKKSTRILEDKDTDKSKKSTSLLEDKDKNKKSTSIFDDKDKNKKSSSKFRSNDAKLKVYDDIWRKVRGKPRAHLKLNKKTVVPSKETESVKKLLHDASKDKNLDDSVLTQSPVKVSKNIKKKDSKNSKSPVSSTKDKKNRSPIKIRPTPSRSSVSRHKEHIHSPNKVSRNSRSSRSAVRESKRSRSRERVEEPEDQAILTTEPSKWIISTPDEKHYSTVEDSKEVIATDALIELQNKFQYDLVDRAARVRAGRPKYEPPQRKIKLRKHKPIDLHPEDKSSSGCSSDESSSEEEDSAMEELEKKRRHPYRLHPELWFNDPNEMNDGPLCRCSAKAKRSGIRHGIYVGEGHLPPCKPHSNNAKRLHHYKICMTPVTNFSTKSPTVIVHNGQKYIFEGFSMFSHKPLPKLPHCKVIRFNYEYTLMYVEEQMPTNFTVAGLELFSEFLLGEILELVDLDWKAHDDVDGCPQFHFMPRFAKASKGEKDEGKELLSLSTIMEYLLKANKPLIDESKLSDVLAYSNKKWQVLADKVKGMIVTCPGMKPSSIRIDQLDREHTDSSRDTSFPVIVHFGVRPPQLSYAGNPLYQKAWREYVKYRHLLANKPKVLYSDRHKLTQKEQKLQEMRMENDLKRDVTIVISGKGFFQTGLMSDMVQHAMLLPILVCHLRFHASLDKLEEKVGYKFQDRFLLQLSLTHPSYRENFGTNPDHARNSLTNCGLRQPQYGDRRIHYLNTRKRGINTLINIMSRFGNDKESESCIKYNERLEFLGDAVVEFLSSIHLFYMFPDLEEGGLATYRAAIVQNQHLAVLSKKLELETFMLYAHGSDLCHDLELKHAMANCFEALMGALFLDAGIEVADKVFTKTLFPEPELQEVWKNYPLHPLQEQEPSGDRQWIESIPLLKKLQTFEEQIGIEFNHIRLLARALTHRSLGYNNLTLGSNQRLEFLGDTVLQLVASEYLYKFFPQHHEGHLSLLRSSLVNNRTQAVVCGDLGMIDYAIYPEYKVDLKPKDKADLLEAFLGALYVDKDLGYCRKFCEVCFFPRLQDFIMNQDWNDPKSKLQQCCLTLRSMDGGEPDIPTYKVIECKGPTNTRVYEVAVYFQGNRLAVGEGHSIQLAEMDAASNALKKSKDLFPQLRHQKRAIERSLKQGPKSPRIDKRSSSRRSIKLRKERKSERRKSRSPKKRGTRELSRSPKKRGTKELSRSPKRKRD